MDYCSCEMFARARLQAACEVPSSERKFSRSVRILQSAKKIVLDLLFPLRCVGCKQEGSHLCSECEGLIEEEEVHSEKISPLERLFFAAQYKGNSIISRLIHRFKYEGAIELSSLFSPLMKSSLSEIQREKIIFVPIPLHWRRKNMRGYNQSSLLAKELSVALNGSFAEILSRTRSTKPQAEQKAEARRSNMTGAFCVKPKTELIPDAAYCLVDDVYTTGSTMNECANVLREAGAKKIYGAVIARAL